ncbi:MAG: glycosyltransferase family 2 protein [Aquificaceae bacterium]
MINVSIVLYKSEPKSLEKTLYSVINSAIVRKIFLVDNSPEDRLKTLKELDSRIVYIFTGKNLGYGKANNIAIRETLKDKTPYHLVLNPDVWFDAGTLEAIYEFMEENPSTGLVMPMVRTPGGEIQYLCRLLPTPFDLIIRRFLSWWPLEVIFRDRMFRHELRCSGYSKIMEVPFLSGCFMLIRAKALQECGLFDERYFLYCDDLDLCRRIGFRYKTIFFPHAQVQHGWKRGSYKNFKLLIVHIYDCFKYFNQYGWINDKYRDEINAKVIRELC